MTTKLLLLDESLLVQRVVELAYRDKGVDVQIAENADEALEMAENAAPDIVVASLDMEHSDGLDFCRRLREKPDSSQVPLLVLTSTRTSVSDEEIQEVGAIANIEKPFKPVVFTDEVERIIGPGHIASKPEPEAQAVSDSPEIRTEESPSSSGDAIEESEETPAAPAAEKTPEEMETAPAETESAESPGEEDEQPSSSRAPLALDSETLAPVIEKHLEEAVEKIAPTLLRHIEDAVVKQLPYIVEKIVIREIEKIKRGE
ncbi:MAG: response regulator [Nitrospinae bacterium]|nr:response regulator [Nitrospinota bacterium]